MTETIESRLAAAVCGNATPNAARRLSIVSVMRILVNARKTWKLLMTAGQLPLKDGKLVVSGLLGCDADTAAGKEAAKYCAINILAQVKAALGDLEKIRKLVKITVFVASAPDFTEQHLVANGASDFLAEVLGDKGKHARSAVGVASLPLNAAVEIEAIVETF